MQTSPIFLASRGIQGNRRLLHGGPLPTGAGGGGTLCKCLGWAVALGF